MTHLVAQPFFGCKYTGLCCRVSGRMFRRTKRPECAGAQAQGNSLVPAR